MKILAAVKKCLNIGKMKDKTGGVMIEKFVGLNPKMYSFLVDNSEHKKSKDVNKIIVATIIYNEYKDHRIAICEINKISLSCFDEKMYIQNNGYDGLALGYQS